MKLTEPQRRYLAEIVDAGEEGRAYNSRAEALLKRLRDAGLVTLDVEVRGFNPSMLIWTAVATEAGEDLLAELIFQGRIAVEGDGVTADTERPML